MKSARNFLLAMLIAAAVPYVCGAFAMASFDIRTWSEGARCAVASTMGLFMCVGIMATTNPGSDR